MENRSEEYQATLDNIIKAGIKAMIAEKVGFNPERIVLLEMSEEDGLPNWVAFEVMGQGYTWDIKYDEHAIVNAYGERLYGDTSEF